MNSRTVLAALLFVVAQNQASAQIQLDRFYPPVVSAGTETIIKAEGKFPTWPVKVICDREDIQVATSDESGQLKVTVPAGAAPGVAWIRLTDTKSASQLVPLCIEPIASGSEVEPNNKIAAAGKIALPGIVYGRLEKSGDIDTYRISVRKGQTLVVSTIAHEILGSPMDAVLQLVDEAGNVLVQSDDVRGFDPQFVYVVDADGDLVIRIFAFPETPNSTIGYAGAASFVYLMRVTTDAFVDHSLPLVFSDKDPSSADVFGWNLPSKSDVERRVSLDLSQSIVSTRESLGWQSQLLGPTGAICILDSATDAPIKAESLPCIFSGHISTSGEIDRLQFTGKKGAKIRATVHSAAFGFPLDSVLRVVKVADGSELVRNDDRQRNEDDAGIEFTCKEDVDYELQVSDLVDGHGPRHAYSVVLEEAKPTVSLSLSADHFAVAAGASFEVTVAIDRQSGFDQPLHVTAVELPAGVTAEGVTSEAKGDSSKSVKLKLVAEKSAAEYSGVFRIVANRTNSEGVASDESFVASHRLRELYPIEKCWLTVSTP